MRCFDLEGFTYLVWEGPGYESNYSLLSQSVEEGSLALKALLCCVFNLKQDNFTPFHDWN